MTDASAAPVITSFVRRRRLSLLLIAPRITVQHTLHHLRASENLPHCDSCATRNPLRKPPCSCAHAGHIARESAVPETLPFVVSPVRCRHLAAPYSTRRCTTPVRERTSHTAIAAPAARTARARSASLSAQGSAAPAVEATSIRCACVTTRRCRGACHTHTTHWQSRTQKHRIRFQDGACGRLRRWRV